MYWSNQSRMKEERDDVFLQQDLENRKAMLALFGIVGMNILFIITSLLILGVL